MKLGYKIVPVFKGEIKDNKFLMPPEEYGRYRKFLLSHFNGPIEMVLRKKINKIKKNRKFENWYWGIFIPIVADYMGEENPDYVHALMKSMFLTKTKLIKGKEYRAVGSTQSMNSEQHEIFVEKCLLWARRDEGLEIPDPDPKYILKRVLNTKSV